MEIDCHDGNHGDTSQRHVARDRDCFQLPNRQRLVWSSLDAFAISFVTFSTALDCTNHIVDRNQKLITATDDSIQIEQSKTRADRDSFSVKKITHRHIALTDEKS